MSNRNLPLYSSDKHPGRRPPGSHAGLWYDKFCNTWKADYDGFPNEGKLAWIDQLADEAVGNRDQIGRAVERRTGLIGARGGQARTFTTRSRLVTGLGREHPIENGFAWHPTLGTPFLPGSSVKGVVKAWAGLWNDEVDPESELFQHIFGQPDRVGSVIFMDAVPTGPARLEADVMTPHYDLWYQNGPPAVPADWHSPTPIPFLTVAAGVEFQFGLMPRRVDDQSTDVDRAAAWLEDALDWIGAGAKTAVGYGRFES